MGFVKSLWGAATPFLALGIMILVQLAYDGFMGKGVYKETEWIQNTAVISAALFTLWLGLWLNRRTRVVVDVQTEDALVVKESHTISWIPIELWGLAGLAYGIWSCFDG